MKSENGAALILILAGITSQTMAEMRELWGMVKAWVPLPLITNKSVSDGKLHCNQSKCFLIECWDADKYPIMLVMRVPTYIPMPVREQEANIPVLLRYRRDFGVSASHRYCSSSFSSRRSRSHCSPISIPTAEILNSLSKDTATALTQNTHLKNGIVLVNQRVDLLQEQTDLALTWHLGCIHSYTGLCVSSIPFNNLSRAANLSRHLGQLLATNWSSELEELTAQLRLEIMNVSSNVVQTITIAELANTAFNLVKAWSGTATLGILMVLGLLLLGRTICSMQLRQQRDKRVLLQAMAAIEEGASPRKWLEMLDS